MHTCDLFDCHEIPLSQQFVAWCLRQSGAWARTKRLRHNLFGSDATKLEELIEKCWKDDDSPHNFRYLPVLYNSHLASSFARWWLLDKHTKLSPWTLVISVQQRSNGSVSRMQPCSYDLFQSQTKASLSGHPATKVIFQICLWYWNAPRGKGTFSS